MDGNRDRLTSAQLAELRAALTQKRSELRSAIDKRQRQTVADDEQLTEEVDVANREVGTAESQGISAVDARMLVDVDDALARMDAGTYGVSLGSGEPIPYARLKAVPWARYDADEEEELERDRRST